MADAAQAFGPQNLPIRFVDNGDGTFSIAVTVLSGGGGGGGGSDHATDTNQELQIDLETAIRDRVTAFVPGATVSAACSTTALAAVAVTAGAVVRFGNAGTAAISVAFGTSGIAGTVTAATAIDILPGTAEAFTVPAGATHFSAIMASGTGTLKYTTGTGS